jgi:hypothetical protein
MLVAWLHLRCGLSRSRTSKTLEYISVIVLAALTLGISLAAGGIDPSTVFSRTHDVRTAIKHLSLEPTIHRSVCCPKCFCSYELGAVPATCSWKESVRSRECGETLWRKRRTGKGSRDVVRRLYTTQDLKSWLDWFIARPGMDEHFDQSYENRPTPTVMRDIWDSPAWKSLGSSTTTYGNLTFSYYIDWFNPLTNKIAGKQVSCGAIMMCCLNLPPHLRHLPENTFFAGLTPPPNLPDIVTITGVQDPVILQAAKLSAGEIFVSSRHPNGLRRCIFILPFLGDLGAVSKACGFAAHNHSNAFCFYCDLDRENIEDLDIENWNRRSGPDVRSLATEWLSLKTKAARKEHFKLHGVRWSSLHHLTYRDHVRHTVLGVMHNWAEGVLQTITRKVWGLGLEVMSRTKTVDDSEVVEPAPQLGTNMYITDPMELDDEMSIDDELTSLAAESQEAGDSTPPQSSRVRRPASPQSTIMGLSDQDSLDEDHLDDDDYLHANDDSDLDHDSDADDNPDPLPERVSERIFSKDDMAFIHEGGSDIIRPTWMDSPPENLGQPKHGKLKAELWLTLFMFDFVILLPELWLRAETLDPRHHELLVNFLDLAVCTHIVNAYSTSNEAADAYLFHYIQFRSRLKRLFPSFKSPPNIHYAMHNRELLKFWGPLHPVSEWNYEHHNGLLQKIPTNGRYCEWLIMLFWSIN